MGAPPSPGSMGRSGGVPSRALGSGQWRGGTTVGLLPLWWRSTHVHRNIACPTRAPTGYTYRSSELYTTPCAWLSGRATTTDHAASKVWSAYDRRAYPNTS